MNNCSTLTFIVCFTAALCRICDEEWRYSPHSRKCYRLFTKPMTWTEAEFHCRMQRANQLSIHNSRENRFFKAMKILKICIKLLLKFIGRAPVTKLTEPCTKMNVTNGEWFQSCCRKSAPYICQKNPQTVKHFASNKQNYEMIGGNPAFEQFRFLLRK
ncbi:lectin C-type domain protein [Onchocerca flexuosa]|uniref:Lectin C-type domain protein n=1 Tax=Onchocerca flexuosa TaxID=387005 RepID=A0A238C5Y3_9BILA|nr:lectin C-type domain protein [Onchocerca flexuosa]